MQPIFHLTRFFFFRFRSACSTSALGTLTSLRANASKALNPLGFLLSLFIVSPFSVRAELVAFGGQRMAPCLRQFAGVGEIPRLDSLENKFDGNFVGLHLFDPHKPGVVLRGQKPIGDPLAKHLIEGLPEGDMLERAEIIGIGNLSRSKE